MEDSRIEGFYLTAMSNAPNPSGGVNKPQNFTHSTQHTNQLQGKWEVALTSILFPRTWFNVKYDSKLVVKSFFNIHEEITIPAGIYDSIDKLVHDLTDRSTLLEFVYNDFSKEVLIVLKTKDDLAKYPSKFFSKYNKPETNKEKLTTISYDAKTDNLIKTLGIDLGEEKEFILPMKSNKMATLESHFPALFVYCNFIDVQYVGNELAPLLRIVPAPIERVQTENDKHGFIEFIRPNYLNLSTGYINSVTFEIRDDTGEPVIFHSGKVALVLHFRPKKI